MPTCAGAERRRELRQIIEGKAVVSFERPRVCVVGGLRDLSDCGLRMYLPMALCPEQTFRVAYNNEEKVVRAIWVKDTDGCSEAGLLAQDVYLIDRLRNGDNESFSDLIAPYMRSLRWTVRAILYNQADVEEVVQESLLKAMLHLDQFHRGQNFRSWLMKIASNEALKCARRNRKRDVLPWLVQQRAENEEEFLEKLMEQLEDQRESPAEALERKEFLNSVYQAMDSLDHSYRQVFLLRDLQHLPMMKIAERLGINVVAANTRLHRARLQMREQLRRLLAFPGRPPLQDQRKKIN